MYDGDEEACLAVSEALEPQDVSMRGVVVDHCNYLGIYIGVRVQHPSVWFRRPPGLPSFVPFPFSAQGQ